MGLCSKNSYRHGSLLTKELQTWHFAHKTVNRDGTFLTKQLQTWDIAHITDMDSVADPDYYDTDLDLDFHFDKDPDHTFSLIWIQNQLFDTDPYSYCF